MKADSSSGQKPDREGGLVPRSLTVIRTVTTYWLKSIDDRAGSRPCLRADSKSLMAKLANPTQPRPIDVPGPGETRKLKAYREPVPTVTEGTTELLTTAKGADTGKMDE